MYHHLVCFHYNFTEGNVDNTSRFRSRTMLVQNVCPERIYVES
jgi:hypothetical protein